MVSLSIAQDGPEKIITCVSFTDQSVMWLDPLQNVVVQGDLCSLGHLEEVNFLWRSHMHSHRHSFPFAVNVRHLSDIPHCEPLLHTNVSKVQLMWQQSNHHSWVC